MVFNLTNGYFSSAFHYFVLLEKKETKLAKTWLFSDKVNETYLIFWQEITSGIWLSLNLSILGSSQAIGNLNECF